MHGQHDLADPGGGGGGEQMPHHRAPQAARLRARPQASARTGTVPADRARDSDQGSGDNLVERAGAARFTRRQRKMQAASPHVSSAAGVAARVPVCWRRRLSQAV
jgi:hypothetical protein